MIKRVSCFTGICMMALLVANFILAEEQEEVAVDKEEVSIDKKEPAAAVVNGQRILMSSLDKKVQEAKLSDPTLGSKGDIAELRKLRKEALNYLIDQELMFQEGRNSKLEPGDAEINVELMNIKQRFPSQDVFEQALKQQNLTEERLRGVISRAMTIRKLIDEEIKPNAEPVTEKEVSDFYEENKEGFVETEKVKARHILIKLSPDASDEEKEYAENEMKGILKEARDGADFAELAKKNSQCPSAPGGGDLGYFTRSQMVKPFEEAAFALKPGEISDVVETRFGYHIILVEDKKPERMLGLEEIAGQIKEVLFEEKIDVAAEEWLKPVREKATVEILVKG